MDHIRLSYAFDGNGGGTKLTGDAISEGLKSDKLAWVHLDANHPDSRAWLEAEISYLDPFIIEALLAEETRPRMTEIGEGVLLILRGVNLNENADPEDMVSIRLYADAHRIISVRKRRLKAIHDIADRLDEGKGPKDAGGFISQLAMRLFERMQPVLTDLDEQTDDIEESITEDADEALRRDIVTVRKKAIIFRRYMAPQRDAISQLRMADLPWMSERDQREIYEALNHITRYVEDLDAIRERAQIVKDELANILANRLNRNMYVLSVIAAIFLPLGFLTGLLGVNVGGIPGSENPASFWIFSGLLVLLVVGQIWVFKKLKWF
ncbi:zinc transporter ZntB [Sneathiella limimaris]|uniref:zinc transporter ZntB n=1 Tax=Sneathiella limimaris TaxID=1964213 RepID=UPI00146E6BCA|nr:zinc transporter ZntB [Sneathiella limimaris]